MKIGHGTRKFDLSSSSTIGAGGIQYVKSTFNGKDSINRDVASIGSLESRNLAVVGGGSGDGGEVHPPPAGRGDSKPRVVKILGRWFGMCQRSLRIDPLLIIEN